MARKLTIKQKRFADKLLETGNGTRSALAVYDTDDYHTAGSIANENLKKPEIVDYLEQNLEKAKSVIVELMGDENPKIRLDAAKDVLDRVQGKAIQRIGGEEKGKGIKIVSVPEVVQGILKDDD